MKKIFLTGLTLIFVSTINSQVQFGLKAGYSNVTLTYSGSAMSNFKTKSEFNGGVFAFIPLLKTFYLQPEIIYSGQGAGSTLSEPVTTNYYYLNVPILFKYLHVSGFFLETGPQIGFLLNAYVDANGLIYDSKNHTHSTDFTWVFGLGYKIPVVNLGMDVRYNLGISNTIDGNFGHYGDIIKNSVFQIDLIYQFKKL